MGTRKADALAAHLFRATGVEIDAVAKELTAASAKNLLQGFDLVVDGFDNSASRREVTEACLAGGWACVHIGLNADYGEVTWNERYRVAGDVPGDVCDYPLARNLIQVVTGVAAEVVLRFLISGAREDYSVTLKDLRINREHDESA